MPDISILEREGDICFLFDQGVDDWSEKRGSFSEKLSNIHKAIEKWISASLTRIKPEKIGLRKFLPNKKSARI